MMVVLVLVLDNLEVVPQSRVAIQAHIYMLEWFQVKDQMDYSKTCHVSLNTSYASGFPTPGTYHYIVPHI